MLAEVLEDRLQEWKRWCMSGRRHRGQCGSLEGNYRSPQHWDPLTWAPDARPIAYRAFEVELIVVVMPDPWRLTLTLFYIRHAHLAEIRRRLRRGWRLDHPEPVLAEAKQRVGAALAGGARPRAQTPTSASLPAHV